MRLTTASLIIGFIEELEEASAIFYENLSLKYPEHKEIFSLFIKQNRKNKVLVRRTYTEVISDALETGFSFDGLNSDDYIIEDNVPEGATGSAALLKAMEIEEIIRTFYLTAAEKSKSLLADLPLIFERIAKKRNERKLNINSLF